MVEASTATYVPGSKRREIDLYPNGRFTPSAPAGGVLLDDSDNSVTGIVKNMLYKMGANLLKGKLTDILKVSVPASVHLPKSYHHMVQKDISYLEFFVREAMARPDDSEWKLKNVLLS